MDQPEDVLALMAGFILLLALNLFAPSVQAKMRSGDTSRTTPAVSDSSFKFLSARSGWNTLSPKFLTILASKFETTGGLAEFAELCEQSGCLKQVVSRHHESVDLDEGDMCLGAMATYLSSFGNTLGDEGKLTEARMAFKNALKIYPLHTPTWMSMCMVEHYLGNYEESIKWADRIIAFKPDPKSKYAWERSLADLANLESQQRVAEALGVPAEDPLKAMKIQARELKAESLRKLE